MIASNGNVNRKEPITRQAPERAGQAGGKAQLLHPPVFTIGSRDATLIAVLGQLRAIKIAYFSQPLMSGFVGMAKLRYVTSLREAMPPKAVSMLD
jgi:hypothetical protein